MCTSINDMLNEAIPTKIEKGKSGKSFSWTFLIDDSASHYVTITNFYLWMNYYTIFSIALLGCNEL